MPVLPTAEAIALEDETADAIAAHHVPRKGTPTTAEGAASGVFVKPDVFTSFRLLTNSISYWLPRRLNDSIVSARSLRRIVS